MFDSFAREKTVTESKIPGTGLGLGIVKKYVELMGGTITVDSTPGQGTTVTVRISHRIAPPPTALETSTAMRDLWGTRVLLAEDNALNAEIAQELLRDFGVEADWVENGQLCVQALVQAPVNRYRLILMDIQMPVMDGLEATRQIRALSDPLKAAIPIVAMTANAFEEDRRRSLEAGMNEHIGKPIDPETLHQVLLRLVP